LVEYRAIIQDQIFWKSRDEFILLIENFINGVIDVKKFKDTLYLLHSKTLDAIESFEAKIDNRLILDSKGLVVL
jgi:hypothetical protein